jgi:type IV pilus biogenesis protein CpaD/CtpE
MFESAASNLLSGLLGRYVDVQRDQLRISLWNGGSVVVVARVAAQSSRHET